jgi:signal transduction histidine kinase
MESNQRRLRTFLAFELVATATAISALLLVWLLILPSGWLLVLSAMLGLFFLLMLAAVRPWRAGRLDAAVWWLAISNWLIALGTTAIATFAWPVLAMSALLPAVFSMPYVSGLRLRLYVFGSILVSVAVAMVGVLQDFSGLSGALPDWVRQAVVIGFTPFVGGMIAQLGLENSAHLGSALEEAYAVNLRLRRSEEILAEQARELRASRARVVAATDRERRRIERDLHDGAQQRLVALSVRLSLVREQLRHDPTQAAEALESLRSEVKAAQVELNQLAQGVYPPVLTEHGLAEALRSAVDRSPNPVELAVDDVGRHARDLEAALYFCCVEALQNAAKHAGAAATIRVALRTTDRGDIEFSIADDGSGFDATAPARGNGFTNMRDRLGAFGGTVEVVSSPGSGTRVTGRVPVDEPRPDRADAATPPAPASAR